MGASLFDYKAFVGANRGESGDIGSADDEDRVRHGHGVGAVAGRGHGRGLAPGVGARIVFPGRFEYAAAFVKVLPAKYVELAVQAGGS
jgi:hypothetical protein